DDLRRGVYDVVIGINLLREGLDLPEVTLVAILDADKEGFLRSRTSLIQTMGRAARHSDGHTIMYADKLTGSMQAAISETQRRRAIQMAYNQEHGITPTTIEKLIREKMVERETEDDKKSKSKGLKKRLKTELQLSKNETIVLEDIKAEELTPYDRKRLAERLRRRMKQAANEMDFELAAAIRDAASQLES
ncbi:MAG TPA: helicase-related protein, partial [Patescibacteria group bacterium]